MLDVLYIYTHSMQSLCRIRMYSPRNPRCISKNVATFAIINPDVVHSEFMTHMMNYVCADDIWKCGEVPIPDLQGQLEILNRFSELHFQINLQGLDSTLWRLLLKGDEDTILLLIAALQQYNDIIHVIGDIVELA